VPAGYYSSAATKTLTDANLVAGNIKNGTSIFGVTGTYVTPRECPTFTLTSVENSSPTVTCDKTYSECVSYTYPGQVWYAVVRWPYGENTYQLISGSIYHDNSVSNSPVYCYVETVTEGIATYKITYASNGTLTLEEDPVEWVDCPVFTANSNGTTITCNKTYSEIGNYLQDGVMAAVFVTLLTNGEQKVGMMIEGSDDNSYIY